MSGPFALTQSRRGRKQVDLGAESGSQAGLERLPCVPSALCLGTVSYSPQRRVLNSLQWLNAVTATKPISLGSKAILQPSQNFKTGSTPVPFIESGVPEAKELVLSYLKSYWQRNTNSVCLTLFSANDQFSLSTLPYTYTVITGIPSLWFSKHSILVT